MADKAGNQGNQAAAGAGGAVRKVKKPRKTKPKMTGTFKESSAYVDPENTELYNLNYNFTLPDTPGEDVLSFRYPIVPPPLPGMNWTAVDSRDVVQLKNLWENFWDHSPEEQCSMLADKPNLLKYYNSKGLDDNQIIRHPETRLPVKVARKIVPYPENWPFYPNSDPWQTTDQFFKNPESVQPVQAPDDPTFQADYFTTYMEVPRRNVLEKVASKVRKTVMGKKKLSEEEAASYEALKKKTPQQAGKPVNQGDYSRDPTAEELQKIMKEKNCNEEKARSYFWDDVIEKAQRAQVETML